jgi:hypothetical protein
MAGYNSYEDLLIERDTSTEEVDPNSGWGMGSLESPDVIASGWGWEQSSDDKTTIGSSGSDSSGSGNSFNLKRALSGPEKPATPEKPTRYLSGGRSNYANALSKYKYPDIRSSEFYGGTYRSDQLPTLTYVTFSAPARNLQRVRSLAQQNAAEDIKELRNMTQSAVNKGYNLEGGQRGFTLRQALAGYGAGLGKVKSKALSSAEGQYEREYDDEYKAAMMNWQAENQRRQAEYQAELDRIWKMAQADAVRGGA